MSGEDDHAPEVSEAVFAELDRPWSARRLAAFGVIGYAVLAALYLLLPSVLSGATLRAAATDLLYMVPVVLAFAHAALLTRDLRGPERYFWLWMTLSMGSFLVGELVWAYAHVFVDNAGPSTPSAADGAFLLGYVFMLLTVASLVNLRSSLLLTRMRYWTDVAMLAIISVTAYWRLFLAPLSVAEGWSLEQAVLTLYPTADLALLLAVGGVLAGFKKSPWRQAEAIIAVGLFFYAASDIAYNVLMPAHLWPGTSWATQLLDLGWMAGYHLFFVAAFVRRRLERGVEVEPIKGTLRITDVLVPALAIVSLPVLVRATVEARDMNERLLMLSVTMLVQALVVLRTALVLIENRMLESRAATDSLTGLYNHRHFHQALRRECQRATRANGKVTIMIIDIDRFREINSVLGHLRGDAALREVVTAIVTGARGSDIVCRLGGDEFGVIMPQTDCLGAFKVGLRVREALAGLPLSRRLGLTVSIGIAAFPQHTIEREELVHHADGALYWAKNHGRDQTCVYDPATVEFHNSEERAAHAEQEANLGIVRTLAAAVDARDAYTQSHSRNVAVLAVRLAKQLGLADGRLRLMEMAALLHDVGKIGVSDRILDKAGSLDGDEQRQVQEHPRIATGILASISCSEIIPWIVAHHERWDGTGYPDGLAGEQIPLEARILSVCDAYDAMTSDRRYRAALSREEALAELAAGAGKQFDPDIVVAFEGVVLDKRAAS